MFCQSLLIKTIDSQPAVFGQEDLERFSTIRLKQAQPQILGLFLPISLASSELQLRYDGVLPRQVIGGQSQGVFARC